MWGESLKLNLSVMIALAIEPVIFALFYLIQVNVYFYYLYLTVTPLLFILATVYVEDVRKEVYRVFLHKDAIFFLSSIAIWLFLYAASRNGPMYVFETAYYPVLIEEINFRFILLVLLRRKFAAGQSVIIQAVLYTIFYSSFLLFYPSGFPGVFMELFLFDNFSMAIIYGFISHYRKNFYISSTIHMALYLVSVFLPASLGWFPQITTPV